MRSLRQILLVALTAIAAVLVGNELRAIVDKSNAPSAAPASVIDQLRD